MIRAVRNNNPGNIRQGIQWHGLMPRDRMTPEQAAEHQFCVFATPADGFRAMATVFHTYAMKDGIKTIRAAIHRWAPPFENNTEAYVQDVCSHVGAAPDEPFDFRGPKLPALCKAVSIHEVGSWAFSDADLTAGVAASR